jgi:Flavin containing amine oxidoreductase
MAIQAHCTENVLQSEKYLLTVHTTEHEESVEAYVRRNLGAEVFERLIEPFCSGVYAGNPANLSMKAAFGKVSTLRSVSTERSHIECQACQTVRVTTVVVGERHLYFC